MDVMKLPYQKLKLYEVLLPIKLRRVSVFGIGTVAVTVKEP